MVWTLGALTVWLGGWWFTGRLFGVYRKVIYLEEARRRRSDSALSLRHHRGSFLFMLLDFGLLLVGIYALDRLRAHCGWPLSHSWRSRAVEWSIVVCLFLIREGTYFHHFYLDQWRARTRTASLAVRGVGTLRSLWATTPSGLRVLFFLAPLLATVPVFSRLLGQDTSKLFYLPGGAAGPFLMWFLLPQSLLLLALLPPITRLRRRARSEKGT